MTRREVNGPTPHLALSIPEFCAAHGISEGMYYKMKKADRNLTPRETKIGTRTLITFEAAADWRREREAASAPRVSKPATPLPPPPVQSALSHRAAVKQGRLPVPHNAKAPMPK